MYKKVKGVLLGVLVFILYIYVFCFVGRPH